jgi:hypothetical protein
VPRSRLDAGAHLKKWPKTSQILETETMQSVIPKAVNDSSPVSFVKLIGPEERRLQTPIFAS